MVADLGVGHDHTALETGTLANLGTRANDDVGADKSGGVDLSGLEESELIIKVLNRN